MSSLTAVVDKVGATLALKQANFDERLFEVQKSCPCGQGSGIGRAVIILVEDAVSRCEACWTFRTGEG